jgi:serine/threonine-protein kinase HipA
MKDKFLIQNMSSLEIRLWGQTVGYLAEDSGRISFEYEKNFIKSGLEISPIELPLSTTSIYSSDRRGATFKNLPGVFADCLPDIYGQTSINNYFFKQYAIPFKDVTPLMSLAYLSNRAMGALEFFPNFDQMKLKDQKFSLNQLLVSAKKIISGKAENVIAEMIRVGSSAGGQKAKAIVDYNPKTLEIRSGLNEVSDDFIPVIIKFDGVMDGEPAGYNGKNEYVYNLVAADCGIKVPQSYLLESATDEDFNACHFITTRFDRDELKNRSYHMATYCGLNLVDFRIFNSSNYEGLMRFTRGICKGDSSATEEMFKRCVFNVVMRNEDDHTKNFSYLMDKKGNWEISPAYDLNYCRVSSGHQMSINGKNRNIQREDLISLANFVDIKKAKANAIIETVQSSARKYLSYAEEVSLPMDFARGVYRNFNFLRLK